MNTSAMYAGQALGAAGGGWLITRGHMAYLSYAGTVVLLSALLTSGIASRAKREN